MVEAASPLFNGNEDYLNFKDNDGIPYFNPTKDLAKWEKAATACKTAIAMCDSAGFKLYKYSPNSNDRINDELTVQMIIRNSVAENNFNLNKEVINDGMSKINKDESY